MDSVIEKDLIYYQIAFITSYKFPYFMLEEKNRVIVIEEEFKTLKDAQNYLYEFLKDFIKNHSKWNKKPRNKDDNGNIWDNMLFDCYNRVEYIIKKKVEGTHKSKKVADGLFRVLEETSIKHGHFIVGFSEFNFNEIPDGTYNHKELHILNDIVLIEDEVS